MKRLTYTAIDHYRKGSHRHSNLPYDVVKARMNALIESSEHSKNVIGGKKYYFGQCEITVVLNRITDIKWDRGKDIKVTPRQTAKMFKAFNKYGLNKSGTKFNKVATN